MLCPPLNYSIATSSGSVKEVQVAVRAKDLSLSGQAAPGGITDDTWHYVGDRKTACGAQYQRAIGIYGNKQVIFCVNY